MSEAIVSRGYRPIKNLSGQRFWRLVVIEYGGRVGNREEVAWKCKCDCGNECVVRGTKLRTGWTKSCGCYKVDKAREDSTTHQLTHIPEHASWCSMIQRCTNPNCDDYPRYGGRGISICDRWRNSFEAFLEDMGRKPEAGMTLERKQVNGNYEPGNCCWATSTQQNRNRRDNRLLEFQGTSQCVTAWADATGIGAQTILKRLKLGWSVDNALSTPVRRKAIAITYLERTQAAKEIA